MTMTVFTAAYLPSIKLPCGSETRTDKQCSRTIQQSAARKWNLPFWPLSHQCIFPDGHKISPHIPAETRHWLSFLRSAQACDLSITDAISELLGWVTKTTPALT